MLLTLLMPKYFSYFFSVLLLKLCTEQGNGEFSVKRSSPYRIKVAQGQTLQLNITLNGTYEKIPMLVFLEWNFRSYHFSFVKRLLSLTWDRGYVVSEKFYDERVSIMDSASLILVNTSVLDSGTYWCNVFSLPSNHYPVVSFNVSVQGKPTAQLGCPNKVNLTEGKNFSCWCDAHSGHFKAKTFWTMRGTPPFLHANRRNTSVELFLQDISRDMAGTYICKAQLYSMIDEKELVLSVFYAPTIRSFQGKFLKDNSMKLTCFAEGFPRPSYVIKISNGLSFKADTNGVIVIKDYLSLANESYSCIAKNTAGYDQWRLNGILTVSKDETIVNRKSFFQDHVWFIIVVAGIVGIILGFLILKTCQSVVCKKSTRNHPDEQDSPVYVDPATLPMSEGRKKDPLNYIDIHVLPTIPQGGGDENMPVYVDPETVVSAKNRQRAGKENRAFSHEQAGKIPDDDGRVYQAPNETRRSKESESDGGEGDIEDNETEDEIVATPEVETRNKHHSSPIIQPKPRANTEPMLGYQDLDSSDEIEENFYHSLRLGSDGQITTEYYVNEKVKAKEC